LIQNSIEIKNLMYAKPWLSYANYGLWFSTLIINKKDLHNLHNQREIKNVIPKKSQQSKANFRFFQNDKFMDN
jgi:hypothetical protein